MTAQTQPHYSGQAGVTWNNKTERWVVNISRGLKVLYLGSFSEDQLDLAIAMRKEADTVQVDELESLKKRYALLRGNQSGAMAVRDSEKSANRAVYILERREPDVHPDLMQALYLALEADKRMVEAEELASKAAQDAHRAEQDAVLAWNAYAESRKRLGMTVNSAMGRKGSVLADLLDRLEK